MNLMDRSLKLQNSHSHEFGMNEDDPLNKLSKAQAAGDHQMNNYIQKIIASSC
jgi:hypothetical protein